MAPRRRLAALAGHLVAPVAAAPTQPLPPFAGSSWEVGAGYQWAPATIDAPGLRASIRDAEGQPTNLDGKPWMADIAAQAAKGGMRPYGWLTPEEAPAFVALPKPLSQCKIGLVSTSGAYVMGQKAYFYKEDRYIYAKFKIFSASMLQFAIGVVMLWNLLS